MNPKNSTSELLESVLETLHQGEALLLEISPENWARKIPLAFDASIGGHYRHCLDHFRNLLKAAASGDLNYDQRERGTPVESDPQAALEATRELIAGYEVLDPQVVTRPLNVVCKTSYATRGSQSASSSVGREIMYSVAHAVHHYALIAFMARHMNLPLSDGFGIAPSTLKYQREPALAQ
jgi:hypothetical protein